MEILIRSARIVDTGSPFNNQVKDILVSDGKIKRIGTGLRNTGKAKEIKEDNLHVSIGWFDLNTFLISTSKRNITVDSSNFYFKIHDYYFDLYETK